MTSSRSHERKLDTLRVRTFLEERDLYKANMTYADMLQLEKDFLENSPEYKEMKRFLESSKIFEDGMTFNEMKDLTKTLQDSLQGFHHQPCARDFADDFCYQQGVLKYEFEENWDHINCAVSLTQDTEDIIKFEVTADVHHKHDFDPDEDLRQKMERISLNENRGFRRIKRSASEFAGIHDFDKIEKADNLEKRGLKRKRRLSFGEPVFTFENDGF